MLPTELLLGPILIGLSRWLMFKPHLANAGAVRKFGDDLEALARKTLPNPFCRNGLLIVAAPSRGFRSSRGIRPAEVLPVAAGLDAVVTHQSLNGLREGASIHALD
jgi:hypothetical protein